MATNGKATATNSLPHVDAAMIMNDEVTPAAPAVEEELEQTVEQLQQHVAALQDKCGRLQAQNILVSVQQLDWLARAIAWSLSAVTVCYYWKLLLWIAPWLGQCYDWTASSESWASTLIFVVESPVLLLQQLCPPMMWEHLISPLLGWIGKAIIFGWPFLHHKLCHGLAFRRFEVFAVFFIVLIRVKLCRWRERMFAVTAVDDASSQEDQNGTTATPTGIATAASTTKTTNTSTSYGATITEDDIWDANYEITARFLYVSVRRLRGLWTKSCQYLSSRADFMPVPYTRELQKLQDEAPQTPWHHVQTMIPPHIREALTDLDETALASASIGQVHTARLRKTGERVVVKVQHPQARTLLLDDFKSMAVFCRIIRLLEPDYAFIEVLMREWAAETKKELDFIQEKQNLIDAAHSIQTAMQHNRDHSTEASPSSSLHTTNCGVPFEVEIPRPYDDLCSRDVLVMSFCEGTRIDNLDRIHEWKLSPTAVMDGVAQTFAHMMYVSNPFNGDPHSGNLFVRPGTQSGSEGFTLVLLDWGLAKRLPEQKRLAFCQMVYAASTFDFGLMLDAFRTLGLKMKRENVAEDMEGVRHLLRDIAPRELSRKRIKAKMKTDMKRMKGRKKEEKIPMESKAYPGEFFFFVRVNELLHGLGSKYGIHLNYVDIHKPYAERGLAEFAPYSSKTCPTQAKVPPTILSQDDALVRNVSSVVEELQKEGHIAGAQVCVLDSTGETLLHTVHGHQGGLKKKIEMRPDALILGYSCTKAVAATMAHIMVKEGYLTYDEPVCQRVWTAFCPSEQPPDDLHHALLDVIADEASVQERWVWKRAITLRHILTHTSGLWSALPAKLTIKTMASCEQCVAAFEYNSSAPEDTLLPASSPGSQTEYHFMSFGWLVAGTLMGAYAQKHGLAPGMVTFEQVYEAVLLPRLSQETVASGFRPCGGGGGAFPMAFIDTADVQLSRILQMQREAEAQGEKQQDEEGATADAVRGARESFRGKEFLLDQRIWNCAEGLNANCPAAGGRFTASGLARFYHDLGSGQILDKATLETVSAVVASGDMASSLLQGPTTFVSMGMGYQVIEFENSASTSKSIAFGHAGVGGSIGFHHSDSGISVAIMLNKADADRSTVKRILEPIAQHFGWQ